jgi:DNA-binding NtrC family response regulator
MRQPQGKLHQSLLIVDDRTDVLHALERFFALYFEQVMTAQDPLAAEKLLRERQPDLLLCDYWLGEEFPPSTEFLPRWRKDFPSLQRIVLMTGTNSSSIPPCPAIDDIFSKPLRVAEVVEYFRSHLVTPA